MRTGWFYSWSTHSPQPFTRLASTNLIDPTGTSSSYYQIWADSAI